MLRLITYSAVLVLPHVYMLFKLWKRNSVKLYWPEHVQTGILTSHACLVSPLLHTRLHSYILFFEILPKSTNNIWSWVSDKITTKFQWEKEFQLIFIFTLPIILHFRKLIKIFFQRQSGILLFYLYLPKIQIVWMHSKAFFKWDMMLNKYLKWCLIALISLLIITK